MTGPKLNEGSFVAGERNWRVSVERYRAVYSRAMSASSRATGIELES